MKNQTQDIYKFSTWRTHNGIDKTTAWRWRKRGWLEEPLNISGQLYITRAQIEKFLHRAAAGDFAIKPITPCK